jgi:hypothetical protein
VSAQKGVVPHAVRSLFPFDTHFDARVMAQVRLPLDVATRQHATRPSEEQAERRTMRRTTFLQPSESSIVATARWAHFT